jgi:hypothetical protein
LTLIELQIKLLRYDRDYRQNYDNKYVTGWILPMIGLILYFGLTILNKYPYVFNYPVKVTNDNAEKLYIIGSRTIRLLKVVVSLSFAFLNFRTIEIALNKAEDIGKLYLPLLIFVLAILIVTMLYKMVRAK